MRFKAFAAAVTFAAASVVPIATGVGGVAGAATPPKPVADSFYTPAAGVASAPGTVLKSRAVDAPQLQNLWGLLGASYAKAYQLQFATRDAKGAPVAAVNTVYTPANPAPGPRKLVSVQVAEDAVSLECAPSYQFRAGIDSAHNILVRMLLDKGWTVVIPDHEGLQSQFLAGPMEGHAVLDSIRAAENYTPAGLPGRATKVATIGYSGGGNASAWANSLQSTYASDIDLVAATAGGIAPDLGAYLRSIDSASQQLFFGMGMAGAIGINRAYPEMGLDGLLNATGKALKADIESNQRGCAGSLLAAADGFRYPNWFGWDMGRMFTNSVSLTALTNLSRVKTVLAKVNLANVPKPTAPMYYYEGDSDIPTAQFKALMNQYGARNGVDYQLGFWQDHGGAILPYFAGALSFIEAHFA